MTEVAPDHDLDRAHMERLAGGHDAALNDLIDRHGQKLFNYLLRCLQNVDDAEDAAQETFVRVYQNRDKFDPNQHFTSWLYTIASNLVKDRYRYRTRHPQVSLEAENESSGQSLQDRLAEEKTSPREAAQLEEQSAAVSAAVASLPDELRIPLILSVYEDHSHDEIGRILNCTAKAVETRIYRARQKLRERLRPFLEQEA